MHAQSHTLRSPSSIPDGVAGTVKPLPLAFILLCAA